MSTTPAHTPARYSAPALIVSDDAVERDLVAQLEAALAPSFVLVRRIGGGGMGIVYLARDPALKRLVAVKVMSPQHAHDPEARARFQREAEAVAAISHPNVVAVHSVGALANGIPYLVMQYVDGPSMAEVLRDEGPMELDAAKKVLGQVASALDAAHRRGIIHRDIKASNILWDDASGRALVTDFGIAAVLAPDLDGARMRLTQTGAVMGTPMYMSPEQLLHEPVTEKTDIYSLGLLGYELMTGEGPYSATSPNQIVAAHLRDLPRPLSLMRPDADPELESLLAACLEKDAHGRPTADDVARRLQHGASVLLEWPPPGLEDMHGAIRDPLRKLLLGSLAIAVPVTFVATVGRDSLGLPQALILPSVGAIGALMVFAAMLEGLQLLRQAVRAARAGYGWGIIAEVLADGDKDTGAVISGEREYAALSMAQRNSVRRWRVLRVGLQLGAAVWSVAGFFVALPFAIRAGSPGLLALSSLGAPLAMLLAERVLVWRERKLLRGIRGRLRTHRSPLDRLSHLAATWKDSFDRVLSGVGLGQGAFGRVKRRAVAIAGVTAVAAVGAVAAYGLMLTSVMGEVSRSMRVPRFTSVQEKATKIERLRSLRPPIDKTITPLEAGHAVQSLGLAGNKPTPNPLEKPARSPLPKIDDLAELSKSGIPGPWATGSVVRLAAQGFTAAQRQTLEQAAAQPGSKEFATLAHASTIDWIGAALVQPFPVGTTIYDIPVPRFALIKQKAYTQIAAAALALADKKPAEAERLLRDNIGAGFAMMDSPVLIENLIGIVIVNSARTELVALYGATGRIGEARLISADSDPAVDEAVRTADPMQMNPQARDAYYRALINDPSQLRGLRFELATGYLAYQPCGDLRQMLFGPDAKHRADIERARQQLAQTPGEVQLMEMAQRALDNPVNWERARVPVTPVHRSLVGFAKAVDALTGARRMQTCASLAPFTY